MSEVVVQAILSNWSPATIKQYNCALKKWATFCRQEGTDRLHPTATQILNFLGRIFSSGASFSTVSSHKSAIVGYLTAINGEFNKRDLDLLNKCMKGFFRLRPPRPRYSDIWDVSVVLTHLKSLGPNDCLNLRQLTLKVTMLFALVAPKRVSELAALSLDTVQVGDDRWVFFIDLMNKNRGFGRAHTAEIRRYPVDELLCPLRTVICYIKRTILYRHRVRTLLLSFNRPHGSVTPTTVARWLRVTLADSGIDEKFKAHSARAASTSASKRQGISSKAIMEAANWAPNGSTFERFYHKVLNETSFQDSVLSSNRCVEEADVIDMSSVI